MSDIRIYDFEFNLLKICHNYISSNWSIYYNDVGSFEAHFPVTDDVSKVLFSNDYLVAVQDGKTAIVTGKQAIDEIVIYGRTPNWLLSKRITLPFGEITGTVEDLTRNVISETYGQDVIGVTKGIMWGEPAGVTEMFSLSRTDAKTTFDIVKECLNKNKAGHRLFFDTVQKAWVYTVIMGRSLPLVVSEDNLNAHDTQYTSDCLDYCSGGWFKEEQPEDQEGNKPDPIWKYIDSDSTKMGLYRWDCTLSGSAENEASDELVTKAYNRQISMQTRNLVWGKDYKLGDIVTAKIIKGALEVTEQKRIKGVHIWSEYGDSGEQPIFED